MPAHYSDRLRVKRGDTALGFRAQCLSDDTRAPANLVGATARLLVRGEGELLSRSLALTVESGTDGWVRRIPWAAGDTAIIGTFRMEVEVTYADSTVQTFPGAGYATLEVLDDLG